jgi:Asp-tRNA(Asn)/Glu-tRNA(Gln) amidotransferase A subunit family amidase
LEQAGRADAEIREGKHRGTLHGIPWGAKDLFATKGIPTTWGAEPYRDQVFDFDATVVERLEKAGAVLAAKLSMGALAQGGLWFGGMTKTPWNLDETSSGSSAGPASATAAGLVGFSIGTETLGSIVSPCTRCGVTGLRPTYGRVSRYGAMGLSWTMDKIGPICRSAEDCALVLHAIYGPDGHDRTVLDFPFDWDAHEPLPALRIGLIRSDIDMATGETKTVLDGAVEALREAGAKLTPVEFPANKSGAIRFLLLAEAAAAFDDITRDRGIETLKGQGPGDWPNTFRHSRLIPAVEYIRAQRARTLLMQQVENFMQDWDVLVGTPASTLVATNLTGHPQVVVPCGFAKGLPVSILFTSGICREGAALRLAHAFQRVTDWHEKQPKMDWGGRPGLRRSTP